MCTLQDPNENFHSSQNVCRKWSGEEEASILLPFLSADKENSLEPGQESLDKTHMGCACGGPLLLHHSLLGQSLCSATHAVTCLP